MVATISWPIVPHANVHLTHAATNTSKTDTEDQCMCARKQLTVPRVSPRSHFMQPTKIKSDVEARSTRALRAATSTGTRFLTLGVEPRERRWHVSKLGAHADVVKT